MPQKFHDADGTLKNIKKLKPHPLYDLLLDKCRLRETEARSLADFLSKLLQWEPKDRISAAELLNHHWLKMIPNYNAKMSRDELGEYRRVSKRSVSPEHLNDSNVDEMSEGGFSDNVQPVGVPIKKQKKEPIVEQETAKVAGEEGKSQ